MKTAVPENSKTCKLIKNETTTRKNRASTKLIDKTLKSLLSKPQPSHIVTHYTKSGDYYSFPQFVEQISSTIY